MVDLGKKSDSEIDAWIGNHERLGKTKSELYAALVRERNRRHGHGLTIERSMQAMILAAQERRFISYGELAEANGVEWTKARHRMNGKHGHLDDLLAYCHANNIPLLTAIVVQKGKLESGEMDSFTLDGFVEGVERLGISVTDAEKFLRGSQEQCFRWAEAVKSKTNEPSSVIS
jgi:hypothetical protein